MSVSELSTSTSEHTRDPAPPRDDVREWVRELARRLSTATRPEDRLPDSVRPLSEVDDRLEVIDEALSDLKDSIRAYRDQLADLPDGAPHRDEQAASLEAILDDLDAQADALFAEQAVLSDRAAVRRRLAARADADRRERQGLLAPGGDLDEAASRLKAADDALQSAEEERHRLQAVRTDQEHVLHELMSEIPELEPKLTAWQELHRAARDAQRDLDRTRAAFARADALVVQTHAAMTALADGTLPLTKASAVVTAYEDSLAAALRLREKLEPLEDAAWEAWRQARVARSGLAHAVSAFEARHADSGDRARVCAQLKAARAALERAEGALRDQDARATAAACTQAEAQIDLAAIQKRAVLLEHRERVCALGEAFTAVLRAAHLEEVAIWEGADALAERLDEPTFAAFQGLARDFTAGLEELTRLGLTPAETADIYQVDLDWPELWWPPRLREQERNWREVQAFFEGGGDRLKAKRTIEEKLEELVLDTQGPVLLKGDDALREAGAIGKVDQKTMGDIAGVASAMLALAGVWSASGGKDDGTSDDPVAALLATDAALKRHGAAAEAAAGVIKAGLTVSHTSALVSLVPGVTAVEDFGKFAADALRAAHTWDAAKADAKAHAQALEQDSRLEASADLVKRRSKSLALRASSSAVANLISFSSQICLLSGVAVPVAVGIRAVGTGMKGAIKAGTALFDWTRADRARATLELARSGDGTARAEVFRDHGRYACALVAILAKEGDPIALAIYSNHGITEEDVQRSFPGLLKRYLMQQLKEKDTPKGWEHQITKLKKLGPGIEAAWDGLGVAIRDLGVAVAGGLPLLLSSDKGLGAQMAALRASIDTSDYTQRGIDQLMEWRERFEALDDAVDDLERRRGGSEDELRKLEEERARVAAMHDGFIRACPGFRGDVQASLNEAVRLLVAIQRRDGTSDDDGDGVPAQTARRFREIVGHHQRSLLLLARVA